MIEKEEGKQPDRRNAYSRLRPDDGTQCPASGHLAEPRGADLGLTEADIRGSSSGSISRGGSGRRISRNG